LIENRALYNLLADSTRELRLPESGIPHVWEEGEKGDEEEMRDIRWAARPRVELI